MAVTVTVNPQTPEVTFYDVIDTTPTGVATITWASPQPIPTFAFVLALIANGFTSGWIITTFSSTTCVITAAGTATGNAAAQVRVVAVRIIRSRN